MKQFKMPREPQYFIRDGLPVYRVDAVHREARHVRPKDVLFILHDTDGKDSRQELYDSTRHVSVHYLTGIYDGNSRPVTIKYMSEFEHIAYGAGYGSIGGISNGINANAVQFEIEYANMNEAVVDAYCATVGQSMRIWRGIGSNVVLLPHRLIDSRKKDPRFDWNEVCKRIYQYSLVY